MVLFLFAAKSNYFTAQRKLQLSLILVVVYFELMKGNELLLFEMLPLKGVIKIIILYFTAQRLRII